MAHGPLICRECFAEAKVTDVSGRDDTGLVCPNCGNESFGI